MSDESSDLDLRITSYVILAVIIGFVLGWILLFRHLGTANEALDQINSLPAGSVSRIDIFTKYGDWRLATVTDAAEIASFVHALKIAEPYRPNHPRYSRSWYVRLQGNTTVELQCSLLEGTPDVIVARFSNRMGQSSVVPGGTVVSRLLVPWIRQHAPGPGEPIPVL